MLDQLDRVFQALSDPSRRAMVERLCEGPATVSELGKPFAMTLAAVVQHVQVLEASGLVRSEKVGRTRTVRIEPTALRTAEQWINERRTLWEAPQTYLRMSPFMYADRIKAPLLLIHGEADNNTGTFPIQSERLYAAIRGNGGTVRYVTLPLEAHGYNARESTEHVLYEMINWFDKYVKNAPPRKAGGERAETK